MSERFDKLEIGIVGPAAAKPAGQGSPCGHCFQLNDPASTVCWACKKHVRPAGEATSGSESSRPASGKDSPAGATSGSESFDAASGLHVSSERERVVLRLNGNVYRDGDADLPEFARRIIAKVRAKGLTPQLMEELRLEIPDVRLRPARTGRPSDGDRRFWSEAGWSGESGGPQPYGGLRDLWGRRRYGTPAPLAPAAWTFLVMIAMGLAVITLWAFVQHQISDTIRTIESAR